MIKISKAINNNRFENYINKLTKKVKLPPNKKVVNIKKWVTFTQHCQVCNKRDKPSISRLDQNIVNNTSQHKENCWYKHNGWIATNSLDIMVWC